MWQDNFVMMLRVLIDDLGTPPRKSDEELQRFIIAAGILVSNDIQLLYDYIFDIENLTIDPDPYAVGDMVAHALFPLKAACLINYADFRTSIGRGIKIRDGDSAIDTTASFRGFRDIIVLGPCASYEKLKDDIEATQNSGGLVGGAVFGPNRSPSDSVGYSTIAWYDTFASSLSFFNPRTR